MQLFRRERELKVESSDRLVDMLNTHRIDVTLWGKSATKTPSDLFEEIKAGETVLVENDDQIMRKVGVAGVSVFYNDGKRKFHLVEEKQIFKNGQERRRDMESSVSEKLKAHENPKKAAERGVREELGIDGKFQLKSRGKSERQQTSPSYPGVASKYVTFRFETWLGEDQYKPDGYIEDDGKKKTYFVWKEA